MVLLLSVFPHVVWADQNNAGDAISYARNQILSCFDVVKDAEAAGTNISELTGVLNKAGFSLSRAEFAYSIGDFTTAQEYAVQSQADLTNLLSDANVLLSSAVNRRHQDFLVNVVGSMVGTVAVLVGGWVLWGFLKKRTIN